MFIVNHSVIRFHLLVHIFFVLVIIKARHKANGIITHKRPGAQPIKTKGEKIKCFQHSYVVTWTSCVTNDFMSCLEVGWSSKAPETKKWNEKPSYSWDDVSKFASCCLSARPGQKVKMSVSYWTKIDCLGEPWRE